MVLSTFTSFCLRNQDECRSIPVRKSKFYRAFVLNRRVVLHAIDATPARWRGGVHPTHWLICAQVLLSSEADDDADEAPVAADPPAPAAAADGGGVDGKLIVQGAAVAAMGAALYFLNTLPGPTSGWAAK